MIKVFKVATIKELQKQVAVGMITYTKMVEIMNELADEAYRESQKSSISHVSDSSLADGAIMEYDLAIKRDLPNTWEHVRDHGRHATFCNALNDIRNKVRENYR